MMKPFFKELIEYSHYTNQKLAAVFMENPDKTSEKSVKLFSHILNAQHIWNNRIEQKQTIYSVWQIQPVEDFKRIDRLNYEHSLSILDRFDFGDVIHYKTSTGLPFTNTVKEILFHVINHSTHHRAQIATEFKQNGLEPLAMDYILYKR